MWPFWYARCAGFKDVVSVVNHRDVVISIGKTLIDEGNVIIALYFICK